MVADAAILQPETDYASAGRRGLEIEPAPANLIALTDATTAPIAP